MKKITFLTLVLISFVSFAQQNQSFTKDFLPVSPETTQNNKIIRNPNATSIVIDGVIIEKKVAKYFSPGELDNKSSKDAKRINYIFLDSFELLNKKELSQECIDKITSDFDLANLNHLRKQDARSIVPVVFNGCHFSISLFSWNEINNF